MGLVCDNCGSTNYQDSWCETCRGYVVGNLRQELAEARAENEKLQTLIDEYEKDAEALGEALGMPSWRD